MDMLFDIGTRIVVEYRGFTCLSVSNSTFSRINFIVLNFPSFHVLVRCFSNGCVHAGNCRDDRLKILR